MPSPCGPNSGVMATFSLAVCPWLLQLTLAVKLPSPLSAKPPISQVFSAPSNALAEITIGALQAGASNPQLPKSGAVSEACAAVSDGAVAAGSAGAVAAG